VPVYVPFCQAWRRPVSAIQGLDRGQQVTRAQMRIPQRHAEGLVPEDFLNIFQRASLHGEMARACVP